MSARKTNTVSQNGIWATAALAAAALGVSAVHAQLAARRAERDHPATGSFVTVDGVRLHYIDTGGTGPTVVLLHGNGTMITEMEISGLVDRLAESHRVIVFDRPGYGHSERPRGKVWTAEAQADLIDTALSRLGVERAILYGHSWGTLVALGMALNHPERIAGMVLGSGYYFRTFRADALIAGTQAVPLLGDLLRYTISPILGRAAAGRTFRKMFAPNPVPQSFLADFPKQLMVRPSQIGASAEDAGLMMSAAAGFQSRYRSLLLPVIIIAGGGDRVVNLDKQSVRLHDVIPGSRVIVVPDTGHMIHHVATELVATAIEDVTSMSRETVAGADVSSRLDAPAPPVRAPAV